MRKVLDSVMLAVNWALAYAAPVLLLALLWGISVLVPMLRRVQVPGEFNDYSQYKPYDSVKLEANLPISAYQRYDEVAFRTAPDEDRAVCFAQVAGLPGDQISISEGMLLVNGNRVGRLGAGNEADHPPVRVPAGCLYLISTYHVYDSWALGPVPHIALMGRTGTGGGSPAAGGAP